MSKKLIIIAFLASLPESKYDQFNQAFALYRESENKNPGFETRLNRVGFSEDGLKNLLYDLQKINDITDLEVANYKAPITEEKGVEVVENAEGETKALADGPAKENPNDEKEMIHIETVDESKPLREEFPFLNSPDCPQLLYVVVGKKIAAFKSYQEKHELLQKIGSGVLQVTEDEQLEITAAAERAFNENRALYDELNHYATTGEILGKHPLFRETEIAREVEVMTNQEMVKFRTASATFFSRAKGDLIKAKGDEKKIAAINDKVAERKYKLDLVNAKLGISE
jgi:hypothetical protein